jgi:hypothetical protein
MKATSTNSMAIEKCDLTNLEKKVFDDQRKLIIKPYSFWENVDDNEIRYFMYVHGIYVLPTQELIDWLKQNIVGNAIEIGAGIGAVARNLGIPITDSRMQELPEVRLMYQMGGQPTIQYPNDVEKLDYKQAIFKYQPQTVIGCFITHKFVPSLNSGNAYGVEEEFILKNVVKYINVGNKNTHRDKPILKQKHQEYHFDWLITRGVDQSKNVIFVFEK